jgi:hypothetical protein
MNQKEKNFWRTYPEGLLSCNIRNRSHTPNAGANDDEDDETLVQ